MSGEHKAAWLDEGVSATVEVPCSLMNRAYIRRGLAGTVLAYKIAGALANRGASLEEVHSIATWVAANVGTIGVGMEHCHVNCTVRF